MFTVRITFLDSIDEYGYVFRDYTFEDVNDARAFYTMKKNEYKDDGLVSVSSDCQGRKMIERLEVYLRKVLSHYADFNSETMKWEITFDELSEMIQFYLDKYWEEKI